MSTMDINSKFKKYDELAFTASMRTKSVNILCDYANKIFDSANEAKEEKDFERAYIFYRRWLMFYECIKKKQMDKLTLKKYFPPDRIKEVKICLEEVSASIRLEFERQNKSQISNSSVNTDNETEEDISLQFPETPSDEPEPKEQDEINCSDLSKTCITVTKEISCAELFYALTHNCNKVLIIDLRKKEDFSENKISFQERIIHIPAEAIHPNKTANYYNNILKSNPAASTLFNRRTYMYTDIVVLVDWNSTLDTITIHSPIAEFKKCLEEDKTVYKKLAVLKGGFKEWINTYPIYVTNPVINKQSIENAKVGDPFESLNYDLVKKKDSQSSPVLSGNHTIGKPVKYPSISNSISDNNGQYLFTQSNLIHQYEASSQFRPLTNGSYNLSQNKLIDKTSLYSGMEKEEKINTSNYTKPFVDRSNKPNLDTKPSQIEQLEKKLEILRCDMKKGYNSKDVWEIEKNDVNMQQEKKLLAEISNLKKSQPNQIYPKLSSLPKLFWPETHQPDRIAKPELKEEKEIIQETRRITTPAIPEKPPIMKEPPAPIMRESPMPIMREPPQNMSTDEDETYTEPLKPEPEKVYKNKGLTRSISSPNLQKVKKLKTSHQKDVERNATPEINRSLKPQKLSDNSDHNRRIPIISSEEKEARLEPVYASSTSHPGITGLKNLGNSCYMNSIVQCLSNTFHLAEYFNQSCYANDLNTAYSKGVAVEVAHVIKALWRGQYKSISPRDLKAVVGQYKMQFESYDQQDSHEFLTFLLDWLHNDLKKKSKVVFDRPRTTADEEWDKSMDGQSSIISKLFFGQLRSTIECQECGKISTTYETFNSLTMSLVGNKCTLDDCVSKFVSGQRVSGWKCPTCKVPREGTKKFDIAKLPQIIVIHLNRFGETGGWLEKKNTAVDFPLTNFNLKPYLVQDEIHNAQSYNYDLYAMSNHYGTMEGGHYTAYCKTNGQNRWYKYDDHTVVNVDQSQVKNQSNSAYLLFYASMNSNKAF